jgi:hypothetical protein
MEWITVRGTRFTIPATSPKNPWTMEGFSLLRRTVVSGRWTFLATDNGLPTTDRFSAFAVDGGQWTVAPEPLSTFLVYIV